MDNLAKIIEITDNNNPASVMHDDPRKALDQVHALALGLSAKEATPKTAGFCYVAHWEGAHGGECTSVFTDGDTAFAFLQHIGKVGRVVSQSLYGPAYLDELRGNP